VPTEFLDLARRGLRGNEHVLYGEEQLGGVAVGGEVG